MAILKCNVPESLLVSLTKTAGSNEGVSHIVTVALSQYLSQPFHTLFQISTSGSLVAGIYTGAVSSGIILQHGDFGIGTFENLDGEMVVLDGHIYQVTGDGRVTEAPNDAAAPFAVVTRFDPKLDIEIPPSASLANLTRQCDKNRTSNNIFYAFRIDGRFQSVKARAVSPPKEHGRLVDAAKTQAEFEFTDIEGTLVGLWSPVFSSAFSIPGYHFHFLSTDRQHGGHLLACSAGKLRLRMEALNDFRLALPENESFLKADLSKNSSEELKYAEEAH